jgi:thiamine-monophosphate kinase
MNKENYFISQFLGHSNEIGDDAAVVKNVTYSSDLFCENVHFKREWMSLKQIAFKAMSVNVSDAIAMNATARYALVNIGIPKSYSYEELEELGQGLKEAAEFYGVEIIGGDTIANIKLDIGITIIANVTKPLLRSTMRTGDLIAYTGEIGESAKGLSRLLRGGNVSATSRFIRPTLRSAFMKDAAKYMTSGMDLSDGLFSDSQKLAEASKLKIQWLETIDKKIGCSGEEYELLFSFHSKDLVKLQSLAKKYRISLNVVGRASKSKRKVYHCKGHHF